DPDDHDGQEDEQGERGGDDDLARHGVGIGDEAQQVADQNEEEDAEDEGEKPHAGFARRGSHHTRGELVGHLAERLHSGRHARPAPRRDRRHQAGQRDREQHVQARIGQRDVVARDLDRNDRMNGELLGRMDHRPRFGRHFAYSSSSSRPSPAPFAPPEAPRRDASGVALGPDGRNPLSAASVRDKRESLSEPPPLGEVRRITFQTPATTPMKKKTIRKIGLVPRSRSSPQPMPAPTRIAEMNSLPARIPSDIPESPFGRFELAVGVGLSASRAARALSSEPRSLARFDLRRSSSSSAIVAPSRQTSPGLAEPGPLSTTTLQAG